LAISSSPVLLLDLDGVIVLEPRAHGMHKREILLLHRDMAGKMAEAQQPYMILTHRSRTEARQILRAAQLPAAAELIAAEDLLKSACTGLHFGQAFRWGLRKSFGLAVAERMTGVKRDSIAVLDDRQHNLDAMLEAKAGIAMKAPSGLSADGREITTFDIELVLESLQDWHAARAEMRQIDLPAVQCRIASWQRTGLSTGGFDDHLFNRGRRIAGILRRSCSPQPLSR
jgi:hypothetical protein